VWQVAEASYIAFTGQRAVVDMISPGDDPAPILSAARERLLAVVDGITNGLFPPRPYDKLLCRACAYPSVCRKDYADVHA
jgi:hypothetical protein